eukprot:245939_1
MATNVVLILSIVLFCIAYCIYLPIAIYSIHYFTQFADNIVIQKRHARGTITLSIFALITMLGEPTRALAQGFNQKWEWWLFIPTAVSTVMLAFSFLTKVFLTYFDIKYAKIIIESEWKQVINPTTDKKNWFIIHKSDYNTFNYWKKHLIFMTLFTMISMYLWEVIYIYPHHQDIKTIYINSIGILYTLFPVLTVAYLRWKTPRFIDHFQIRHEIQLILIPGACLLILLVPLMISYQSITDQLINDLLHLLSLFIFSTYSLYVIFICTVWVIRKNSGRISAASNANLTVQNHSNVTLNIEMNDDKKNLVTLENVLNTKQGFAAFMSHVGAEFSTEILLCLVELLQFQNYIFEYCLQYYDNKLTETKLDKMHFIEMTDYVPKSSIVYTNLTKPEVSKTENNDDKVLELMAKAHRLYRKYIKFNCSLEINISFELRNRFIVKMDKIDVWIAKWESKTNTLSNLDKIQDIYDSFTTVIEELTFLLDSSFFRFKSSSQFQLLNIKPRKRTKSWHEQIKFSKVVSNSNTPQNSYVD